MKRKKIDANVIVKQCRKTKKKKLYTKLLIIPIILYYIKPIP